MTFDFRYPTPLPSTKGWGSGYPNCRPEARAGESIFWPGVHRDIAELVQLLVDEMERRGFRFMEPGCWGFGCRATKGASGETPSFHSWGLAIDINAPENVFGADEGTSDIATRNRWVVTFLQAYGFFWLGPAIKDWMHFSFVGSPQDARDMTERARRELGEDMGFQEYKEGRKAHRAGLALDPEWPNDKQFGWRERNAAMKNPPPEHHTHPYAPAGHAHPPTEHTHTGTVEVS